MLHIIIPYNSVCFIKRGKVQMKQSVECTDLSATKTPVYSTFESPKELFNFTMGKT